MKRSLFLLATILALFGRSTSQTDGTTAGSQTDGTTTGPEEGSGGSTPSPVDPCLSDPCVNGDCSATGLDDNFKCDCYRGYSGEICDQKEQCTGGEFTTMQVVVRDGITCGSNETVAAENNTNVTITFGNAPVGTFVESTQTCTENCIFTDQPIATIQCNEDGTFGTPQYIDCSAELNDLLPEEQLPYAVGATSDPQAISAEDATLAIDVATSFTSEVSTLSQEQADAVMEIFDNLLEADGADAKTTVQQQTADILTSVGEIASKVALTSSFLTRSLPSAGYLSVDEVVALGVGQVDTASGEYYFGSNKDLTDITDLTGAGLTFTSNPTFSGSYVKASTNTADASDARISFGVYSTSNSLFPITDNIQVRSVVLSGNYINATGNFTFNFMSASEWGSDDQCRKWDRTTSSWITSDCSRSIAGRNIQCVCGKAGEYAITQILISDGGLSAGAIAGIVVGSVVGAALIGGGIYYFAFYKKKMKANAVGSSDVKLKDVEGTSGNN